QSRAAGRDFFARVRIAELEGAAHEETVVIHVDSMAPEIPTETPTPTPTMTPSTPTPTPTMTGTPTETPRPTATPTETPIPRGTPTPTPTETPIVILEAPPATTSSPLATREWSSRLEMTGSGGVVRLNTDLQPVGPGQSLGRGVLRRGENRVVF